MKKHLFTAHLPNHFLLALNELKDLNNGSECSEPGPLLIALTVFLEASNNESPWTLLLLTIIKYT